MKWWCAALSIGIAGRAVAAGWDPYATPKDEFERRLDAAAFGQPGADRALEDWLAAHPQLPPEQRLLGYDQLCTDYDALTWFRLRLPVCTTYARLKSGLPDDTDRAAIAFADQPPVRAIGSAKVPLTWNKFGCQSVEVTVNDVEAGWFFDTGAEITVVRAGLAREMGVRILAKDVGMATTTADVSGESGMIDRLRIGTSLIENVPVLVLPDAQLNIAGVGQIDGVLGLQVMLAFGRVAWVDGGRALALGEIAPRARSTAPRLYWHEEGVGVPVRTGRGVAAAFLDTGANTTRWRTDGLPLLDPGVVRDAKDKVMHVGGAGGVVELHQRELRRVDFALGLAPVHVEKVALTGDKKHGAAQIGMDAVSQFGTFILDFEQMRIDGRLKTPVQRKVNRQPAVKRSVASKADRTASPPK
jgi:hypothetical protein